MSVIRVVYDQNYNDHEYRMIQLNDNVLQDIQQGTSVFIKGEDSGQCVLSTSTKSYAIEKINTSNTVLLCEQEDNNTIIAKGIAGSFFELLNNPVDIRNILTHIPEYTARNNENTEKVKIHELYSRCLYSEKEIQHAIETSPYILEDNDQYLYYISSQHFHENLIQLVQHCILHQIDFSNINIEDIMNSNPPFPAFYINHLLKWITNETLATINKEKLIYFLARGAFLCNGDETKEWLSKEDLQNKISLWLPSNIDFDIIEDASCLQGVTIHEMIGNTPGYHFVDKDILALNPSERFRQLFTIESEWTQEDLLPFISELESFGFGKPGDLLLQFCREVTFDNGEEFFQYRSLVMDDSVNEKPFYSIDAVMFDSKKKKNPNSQIEEKEYEENNKGKKMKITFDGIKLVYNKSVLLVDDMIAVASSKAKEIVIHSLPPIGEGYRDRYWKKSKIQFSSKDQASEWFDILHKAIENSRYTAQAERGPIVEFADNSRVKRVRVILNPHGGKGDAQQVFNTRILPILQIAGIQCDIEITKYASNAKDLAITHEPDKYEGVLLVSGDGLVNQFVNGLMQRVDCCYAIYNTPICHVSAGTQNQIAGGLGTSCYETAAYCIIKHRIKALDVLKVMPKDLPIQYSLCGVVSGIGGDMVKDYEEYRKYGFMRYPLLKVKWGLLKRQKHITDIIYTPVTEKLADYQKQVCQRYKVNCPVCKDGYRNYYHKPIKCPHQTQQEVIQPELSLSDIEEEEYNEPMMYSNTCSCEYPRWCKLVGNREWIDDDVFEITGNKPKSCCKPSEVTRSEDHPEQIHLDLHDVEEKDMQYLTIGIVVNAPYDGEFCHCCDGSLDVLIARSGNCCQTTGLICRYVTKTHLGSPLMDYFKAKKVILRYPGENTVNVDGEELTYNDELVIEVCEAGVSCYGEL